MPNSYFEKLRNHYRPDNIDILFVGEPRPISGKFFYKEDSNLYRETKKAFNIYFGENIFTLDAFKNCKCWLYDICENPVNDMNHNERQEEILQNLPNLEKFIESANPKYIVVCKKGIVKDAIIASNIMNKYRYNETIFFLPFPVCGRQKEYRDGLINILKLIGLQNPLHDFICPYPKRWNEIFQDLCTAYERKTGKKLPFYVVDIREAGGPPTPLILNGWVFTGDCKKRQRWIETINWAKKHDLLHFLVVEEKDKYYGA